MNPAEAGRRTGQAEPTRDVQPAPTEAGFSAASRQAKATRQALMNAAVSAFAEYGFEAASVRDITAKAKVNQGAITYHFGGKDGLYRAVLEMVRDQMGAQPLLDVASVGRQPLGETVRLFLRQMLAPLAQGPRAQRHLRIFAWEQLRPTAVRRKLSVEKPFPPLLLAQQIVRRARPDADEATVAIATAWMMGQVVTFVRDRDYLAGPPLNLAFDAASLDRLVECLTGLCLCGLAGSIGRDVPPPVDGGAKLNNN